MIINYKAKQNKLDKNALHRCWISQTWCIHRPHCMHAAVVIYMQVTFFILTMEGNNSHVVYPWAFQYVLCISRSLTIVQSLSPEQLALHGSAGSAKQCIHKPILVPDRYRQYPVFSAAGWTPKSTLSSIQWVFPIHCCLVFIWMYSTTATCRTVLSPESVMLSK